MSIHERERLLSDAVKAGKFTEDRKPTYRKAYDADPARTTAYVESLTPAFAGVVGPASVGPDDAAVEAIATNFGVEHRRETPVPIEDAIRSSFGLSTGDPS